MDYKKVLQYTQDLAVLYIEDDKNLLEDTSEILEDYFQCLDTAINGQDALEKYHNYFKKHGYYYDLIITDINMPIMDGEQLITQIESINVNQVIIVVSAYNESSRLIKLIQSGITNFVLKPVDANQLISMLHKTCKNIFAQKKLTSYYELLNTTNEHLDNQVKDLSKEILATQRLSVETIGNMVESYDDDTGSHVKRIEAYTELMMDNISTTPQNSNTKEIVAFSSLLHDIGKLVIPKHILQKPSSLNYEEFEIIKTHAKLGGEILLKANEDFKKEFGKDSYFKIASDIAFYHHEKYDGTGYPCGLKGNEIPECARIVAIVDAYDALRSKRVYKDNFSHKKAMKIIKKQKNISFDPYFVEIFLNLHEEFNNIFELSNSSSS